MTSLNYYYSYNLGIERVLFLITAAIETGLFCINDYFLFLEFRSKFHVSHRPWSCFVSRYSILYLVYVLVPVNEPTLVFTSRIHLFRRWRIPPKTNLAHNILFSNIFFFHNRSNDGDGDGDNTTA